MNKPDIRRKFKNKYRFTTNYLKKSSCGVEKLRFFLGLVDIVFMPIDLINIFVIIF